MVVNSQHMVPVGLVRSSNRDAPRKVAFSNVPNAFVLRSGLP